MHEVLRSGQSAWLSCSVVSHPVGLLLTGPATKVSMGSLLHHSAIVELCTINSHGCASSFDIVFLEACIETARFGLRGV